MASSGYVAGQAGAGGGYRLDTFDAVLTGRCRELTRTALIVVGLFVAQWPLRKAAEGTWDNVIAEGVAPGHPLLVEVPGRLSLVIDAALIIAYVFVAYRAFGLVRSFRPPRWVLTATKVGVALVLVGAAADIWEDVRLWDRLGAAAGPAKDILTLSFDDALGGGPEGFSFSLAMRALVVGGLLVEAATFLSFIGARGRHRSASDGTGPTGTGSTGTGGIVICCSGGGIRSAAFSLGGIQALTERNIYQRARSVVGVSGGGYMGAACHVARWNPRDHKGRGPGYPWTLLGQEPPPFGPTSPETQWLRRHTRYVLDTVRVAVQGALSLGFGIAVNLLLVTVAIGGLAWVIAWTMLASGRAVPWSSRPDGASREWWWTRIERAGSGDWVWLDQLWWVPALGVGVFLLERLLDRYWTLPRRARQWFHTISSWLVLGGLALAAVLVGVPWLVTHLSHFAAHSDSALAGLLHQVGLVPSEVCDQVLRQGKPACGVTVPDEASDSSVTKVAGVSLATVLSAILAVLASVKGSGKQDKETSTWLGGLAQRVWKKVKDPLVPWLAVVVIVLVAVLVLLRWVAGLVAEPDLLAEWKYAAVFAGLVAGVKVLTDANRTSLHHFFRERISNAFLVRRGTKKIEPVPYRRALRFSEAAPRDGGPALVSCAVANVTDDEVVPSKRGCIPFVFGHDQIGLTDRLLPVSAAQRASGTYEFAADHRHRDATIPAAIAMSAAAFSPLVGRENVKLGPYRAVLALANARLGVWLPNPLWLDEGGIVRRLIALGRAEEAARIAFGPPASAVAVRGSVHLRDKHRKRLRAVHRAQRSTVSAVEMPTTLEVLAKLKEVGATDTVEQLLERAEAEASAVRVARQQAAGLADPGRDTDELLAGAAAAAGLVAVLVEAKDMVGAPDADAPGAIAALEAKLLELRAPLCEPVRALTPWWSPLMPAAEVVRTIFKKPGLTRLVKEGVGKASVFDRFLYVTDGGHYDNLGLIEALRQRPKVIYVLDASNDPEDTFRTLGRAIATARMDLDCEITMDPRGMRRLQETRSGSAWCSGEFVFADDPNSTGSIFLAKAIMLGDLSWDIETYSHDNLDFPRTGTHNQLYSEFDFEAYRALGQSAVERMLASREHLDALVVPPLSET